MKEMQIKAKATRSNIKKSLLEKRLKKEDTTKLEEISLEFKRVEKEIEEGLR